MMNYEQKLILEKGAGVEQISPINPDLIILKTSMKDEIGTGLEKVGLPVLYVSFEDIEKIYEDIQIIGKVLEWMKGRKVLSPPTGIFKAKLKNE